MSETDITDRPVEVKKDYDLLLSWWKKRNFTAPPKEWLSPLGLMVFVGNKPVCAGFLFKTDSNVCSIGNLVSDPSVPGIFRDKALDYLLVRLQTIAKDSGFTVVCAATNLERLVQRYKRLGFMVTDEGITQLGRTL